MQQRAIAIMPSAFEKQNRWNIQIYHPPGLVQPATIFRIHYDAPAGSHYDAGRFSKLLNCLSLPSPETILTFNFEDRRNWHTGALDNLVIRIKEWPSQALRQLTTDSCFASPH